MTFDRLSLLLDTGALIAFERQERHMREVLATARAHNLAVMVPTAVLVEW